MLLNRNDGSNRLTTRRVFDSEGSRKYRTPPYCSEC